MITSMSEVRHQYGYTLDNRIDNNEHISFRRIDVQSEECSKIGLSRGDVVLSRVNDLVGLPLIWSVLRAEGFVPVIEGEIVLSPGPVGCAKFEPVLDAAWAGEISAKYWVGVERPSPANIKLHWRAICSFNPNGSLDGVIQNWGSAVSDVYELAVLRAFVKSRYGEHMLIPRSIFG